MDGLDLKVLKRLTKLMDDTGLVALEVELEGVKVKLQKAGAPSAVPLAPPAGHQPPPPPPAAPAPQAGAAVPAPSAPPPGHAIRSPMVGTFYRAPSPQSPPFVNAGDEVKEGQTLCLIEAMKLMNEIKTDRAGKVSRILVENGQPVEFDQPLIEFE